MSMLNVLTMTVWPKSSVLSFEACMHYENKYGPSHNIRQRFRFENIILVLQAELDSLDFKIFLTKIEFSSSNIDQSRPIKGKSTESKTYLCFLPLDKITNRVIINCISP